MTKAPFGAFIVRAVSGFPSTAFLYWVVVILFYTANIQILKWF